MGNTGAMATTGHARDAHVLLAKSSDGVDAEDFEDTVRARPRHELTLFTAVMFGSVLTLLHYMLRSYPKHVRVSTAFAVVCVIGPTWANGRLVGRAREALPAFRRNT